VGTAVLVLFAFFTDMVRFKAIIAVTDVANFPSLSTPLYTLLLFIIFCSVS
jgi:hypothetical protein